VLVARDREIFFSGKTISWKRPEKFTGKGNWPEAFSAGKRFPRKFS
jgi:hypothetical protein